MIQEIGPLVSIGLPVFNGEQFLRRGLDALLGQDYAHTELIISDNASTDQTQAICKEYAAADARIRYVRQPTNLGPLGNFNFVLQQARGEYFMWAGIDDQWARNFISCLLEGLLKSPEAVGAFCRYQLVQEETGLILEGIWKCSYEDPRALVRLLKFTWEYRDPCLYGLMRRAAMNGVQFQPWAWINADTPYNNAYPLIYFLISKGPFLSIGQDPLWHKSVRVSHWHSTPFTASPLVGYFAHIVRKINLLIRSAKYVRRGSQSALLVVLMIPFLSARCAWDCLTPIVAALRIWLSGRKISQLSPHEIWRLGVR